MKKAVEKIGVHNLVEHTTFVCPCILSITVNDDQQDATI